MPDGMDKLTERVQVVEVKVDHLTERVQVVELKVDDLSTSLNELSASVDQRFDQVDAALGEQRQYTEFGYARLEAKMDAGYARLDRKMDGGFSRIERKLDQFIDVQLQTNELVDRRLRALEETRAPDAQP